LVFLLANGDLHLHHFPTMLGEDITHTYTHILLLNQSQ